jgi:hypothetical protein
MASAARTGSITAMGTEIGSGRPAPARFSGLSGTAAHGREGADCGHPRSLRPGRLDALGRRAGQGDGHDRHLKEPSEPLVCRDRRQDRRFYREAGKTKNRTLPNLSRWPAERIEQLRAVLRGDQLLPAAEAVEIVRALPHGHVLAALGTARRIALDAVLPRRAPQRRRDLALALIIARLLEPAAKLATARMLDPATASHSLGEVLGLGKVVVMSGVSSIMAVSPRLAASGRVAAHSAPDAGAVM